MARFAAAEPILNAAAQWKSRCLLGGGSLFTERRLWTREGFGELGSVYLTSLDAHDRPSGPLVAFRKKLERILSPASEDAICLWAEMAWVYHLARKGPPGTKISAVREIWGWSGRDFPEGHELLSDAAPRAEGVPSLGPGYHEDAWREYSFFVHAMLAWFLRHEDQRKRLLTRPWEFASALDKHTNARQLRHVLLFLLFPDHFEPVFSRDAKRRIIKGFGLWDKVRANRIAHEITALGITRTVYAGQLHTDHRIVLDLALVGLRQELELRHPGEEVHFYRSPWREKWQGGDEASRRLARGDADS